jgi:hypothetical protein
MRTFFSLSISISVVVGICSVFLFLFKQEIVDFTANVSTTIPPQTNLTNPTPDINATMSTTAKLLPRLIRKSVLAIEQSEGAGARVRRSIGTPQLRNFSPFLMLDRTYSP